MMDITVSRVRNVVDFKVDHESLRKAKNSIKGIKEFAESQKIAIKPFVDQRALNKSMKQAIKQARANNVIMQNAQNKANNRGMERTPLIIILKLNNKQEHRLLLIKDKTRLI